MMQQSPEFWPYQVLQFIICVIILVNIAVLCFFISCCFVTVAFHVIDAALNLGMAAVRYVQGRPNVTSIKSYKSVDLFQV